jgi:hypothetical protein
MRSIFVKFAAAFILVGWCVPANAQDGNVSVGAVTRYSGIATNQADIKGLRDLNEFLNVLESQLAKEFVNHGDIDYLDRMNTEEVFQELHLSSSSAFNSSSGALRGLLGRLDFLVVIDSAEPTTARVRLIDVESGAVKALETCKRKTSLLGFTQDGPPDCIAPFVAHARDAARVKLATKAARRQQQAAQGRASEQKTAAERKARIKEQQEAQRTAQAQAEATAKARFEEKQNEQRQAEGEAKAQAELDARLSGLRPGLDDAVAHLSSTNDFWGSISKQLASSGLLIRSDVRTALSIANADSRRCQEFLSQGNADELETCISKLNSDLDRLDRLK